VGNFGNAPLGLLTNPSFSNWDMTLARRIPVKIGRNGGARVQFQVYNVFNQQTGYNIQPNFNAAGYGLPDTFYFPRRLELTLKLNF